MDLSTKSSNTVTNVTTDS